MHRLLALFILACALRWFPGWGTSANAQGFSARFDTIGSGYAQVGWAVREDGNGDFVISSNGGWVDWVDSVVWGSTVTMLKLSEGGQLLSAQRMDADNLGTYPGMMSSIVRLPDGRWVIGGSTWAEGWIQKPALYWFGPDGNAIGFVDIDERVGYIGRQVKRCNDGGFMLVGDVRIGDNAQGFLLKTDSLGQLLWSRTYGGDVYDDYIYCLDHAPNGGFYLGGVQGVETESWDPWLMRCDSLGNVLWSFTNGTPYYDNGRAAVTTLADGNFVYSSGVATGVEMLQQPQLVKVDSFGNVIWQQVYDTASYPAYADQVKEVTPGGDLIACGTSVPIVPYTDAFLLRTTSEGDSIWLRHYWYSDSVTHNSTCRFHDVTPTSDGGFIAVGAVYGAIDGVEPPGSNQDVWVLKVDSLGCIIPGCDDFSTVITAQVINLKEALEVFPNPVHGTTAVKVTLPVASPFGQELALRLVSAQGQEVLLQRAVVGENELDVRSLAAGVYYLHLTNDSMWLSGMKIIVE